MNAPDKISDALQPFVPNRKTFYPIDAAARLARMPRHQVLLCYKYRLVSPQVDPEYGGYYFDEGAIRTLQRIEYLHAGCGINFVGIKIILELMNEVERSRTDAPFGAS